MKLSVLPEEKFSCQACSQCCRYWHVELSAEEIDRLHGLRWPGENPIGDASPVQRHSGKTYLNHRPDGYCVFHNQANGYCRIHEQFGVDVKPLGCQLYPFQIVPTFDGEATVTTRYNCPTVRKNFGAPHAKELPQLRAFAKKMDLPDGFDDSVCAGLSQDQIESLCEFTDTLLHGFARGESRALFIAYLCDWIASRQPAELSRESLAAAYPELRRQVEAAVAAPPTRPGLLHRLTFRTVLGLCLRRDEDVIDRRAGRVSRLLAMFKFVFGFGGFKGLGVIHPPGTLARAKLFGPGPMISDPSATDLHWRMISVKLQSLQFFGSANYGRDVLSGLRSLSMLYPYVIACAKYRAANRDSSSIEAEDIDYAVSVIEHSFGRSPVLAQGFARVLEAVLMDRAAFTQLILTI